jgi:hypothetical protein
VLITPRIVVEPTDAIEGQEAQLEHESRATHLRKPFADQSAESAGWI